MPDMPRLNLDEVINKVFWPNFLKVVLPFVIAGLIFVIIRLLFRRALWDMPKTKMIVDFVLDVYKRQQLGIGLVLFFNLMIKQH